MKRPLLNSICAAIGLIFVTSTGVAADETPPILTRDQAMAAIPIYYERATRPAKSPEERDEAAEWMLAQSLSKGGFHFPALYFYRAIYNTGVEHRYFYQALTAMAQLAEQWQDDLIIPTLLNSNFNQAAIAKLPPLLAATVNYGMAMHAYRQGNDYETKQFLMTITEATPLLFGKAQYLLGVLWAKEGSVDEAIVQFKELLATLPKPLPKSAGFQSLRNLTTLALARLYYAGQDPTQASYYYDQVSRDSDEWFEAMAENAQTALLRQDYGRALGLVQSVMAPQLIDKIRLEPMLVAVSTFNANCDTQSAQFGLKLFSEQYLKIKNSIDNFLIKNKNNKKSYEEIIKKESELPLEIIKSIKNNKKLIYNYQLLLEINKENSILFKKTEWKNMFFFEEIAQILNDQKKVLEFSVNDVFLNDIKNIKILIEDLFKQANAIKDQIKPEEKEKSEKSNKAELTQSNYFKKNYGKSEISDNYQFWLFNGEYWIDEIGYYYQKINNKCN